MGLRLRKNLFILSLYHLLSMVDSKCRKSFECGKLGTLRFPFSDDANCGLRLLNDCDSDHPTLRAKAGGSSVYFVSNLSASGIKVSAPWLYDPPLAEKSCSSLRNLSTPQFPSLSFTFSPSVTLFACSNLTPDEEIECHFQNFCRYECSSPHPPPGPAPTIVYYKNPTSDSPSINASGIPTTCSMIQLPRKPDPEVRGCGNLFDLLTNEFELEWNVSQECQQCHHQGGQCLTDVNNEFRCGKDKSKLKLILATSLPVVVVLLVLSAACMIWKRKKKISGRALFLSRNISSNPNSKSDIETGSFFFGIPVFSYPELEEATNNFDPSKELGDGGFGTVYHGKLTDGRDVAIKRLYEHNYRRMEQFLNEIQILTCLRHPNLVSLYGCTSRRSRELLLVYEYISNGTVADHLHGERANEALLSWPNRMRIAMETASALAYLHKKDIIHRDVKTNNILLDNNFSVKVADFGLSRLFPNDVSHISTAPQGTPGYVDPEYHQCYQLTDKSDVYSFGVVLIELISSMPAVDITRHRHEINLANLAVNRIQQCAFDELIDSSLGYDSDPEATRMTTSVAELAFRCLQLEKDLRPSMDEIVSFLRNINGGEGDNIEQMKEANGNCAAPGKIPPSPEIDDAAVLLKKKNLQSSPTAVTDTWASSASTTGSSIGG